MQILDAILGAPKPRTESLHKLDWFDNSSVDSWQKCNRLGFYGKVMMLGRSSAAMSAGKLIHVYIENFHIHGPDVAQREFAKSYQDQQQGSSDFLGKSAKYQFPNLARVVTDYAAQPKDDFHYVATEIPFAIWFGGDCGSAGPFCECAQDSPTRCFWFVGRMDGLVRDRRGEFFLLENKTSGSLTETTLRGYDISRQAQSYTFSIRKLLADSGIDPSGLRGVLFNVISFGSATTKFARHPVFVPEHTRKEWESELRRTVAAIRSAALERDLLPIRNTNQCTSYGICGFYDLCKSFAGRTLQQPPDILGAFPKSDWSPLS